MWSQWWTLMTGFTIYRSFILPDCLQTNSHSISLANAKMARKQLTTHINIVTQTPKHIHTPCSAFNTNYD